MNNLKIKMITGLISFVTFILVLALGNQAFAADPKNMNELMEFAGTDQYFSKMASSFLGVKYKNSVFNWKKYKTGYCINHDWTGKGTYVIKHVIDIDLDKTPAEGTNDKGETLWYGAAIKVWSGSAKKPKIEEFNSREDEAHTALMWSYLAYDAYHDNGRTSAGDAKHNFYWMLKKRFASVEKMGIDKCFIPKGSTIAGQDSDSYKAADAYADKIKKMWIKDRTNEENVYIEYDETKDYTYIGPYKITYGSTKMSKITLNANDKNITADGIATSVGGKIKDVSAIETGEEFYIVVKGEITKAKSIKLDTEKYTFYRARIILVDAGGGNQSGIIFRGEKDERPITMKLPSATVKYGNLTIKKIDKDTKKPLPNVGFIIRNVSTGQYVTKAGSDSAMATYGNKDSAATFKVGPNGEAVTVKGLLIGKYEIYETINPNYGYVADPSKPISTCDVRAGSTTPNTITIPNEQIYVKLSGYVWVDKPDGKTGFDRNDHFKTSLDGSQDTKDLLFNGITVRLKDSRTGATVKINGKEAITTTSKLNKYTTSGNNGNGEYEFKDVLISDLPYYYVEFEYDGLTYQNVVTDISMNSGSKAAEGGRRTTFNEGFSVIEGESENTGIRRNVKGDEEKNDLTYALNENKTTATLTSAGKTSVDNEENPSYIQQDAIGNYTITSNTKDANYVIKHTAGEEEIRNINLGLYERDQPDITLGKDIDTVKLSINGYNHVYEYNQRYLNEGEYSGSGFNVGVKFPEKFSGTYTRPIYKSDYDYRSPDKEKSNELEVFVTYKIAMLQGNNNLKARVNSVVDYYDGRYAFVKAGTGIEKNEEGRATGELTGIFDDSRIHRDDNYNGQYKKVVIDNDTDLNPNETNYIFVQFKLNRDLVRDIINDKQPALDNVAEINSYSVFDMVGNTYAGIDHNSNPGNSVPGAERYENDTDKSPSLKLEPTDARRMTGKVFLDETNGKLMTGEVREGDGEYKEGEQGIQGVQINLVDHKGSGKSYTAETNGNGDFSIENYIPGDYTLTYTWGGQTYKLDDGNDKEITVQDYKGTIYKEKDRQNNPRWWHTSANPEGKRYSDAIDNYETRKAIDAEMQNVKYDVESEAKRTIHTMDSTTPNMMEIGVEYDTVYSASAGDKYVYEISGVDFGIVERARQSLALEKRVKSLKATLANGQVIADLTIEEDENGNRKVVGERNGITYMKPDANTTAGNGFIRLELDNELIQGARLEVGYEIRVINQSELDYIPKEGSDASFYKYGKEALDDTQQLITITPTGIIDYLDNGWAFDNNTYNDWQAKEIKDITEGDNKLIADNVYNNEETTIATRKILYTDKFKNESLAPSEERKLDFTVSKILATTDEISLDNEVEVVELNRPGGSIPESIPGNYVPGTGSTESDDSMAETTIVTPATGENQNYILPVVIVVTACIILGAGIIFIKKKAI